MFSDLNFCISVGVQILLSCQEIYLEEIFAARTASWKHGNICLYSQLSSMPGRNKVDQNERDGMKKMKFFL
jgi:hypothetical protein